MTDPFEKILEDLGKILQLKLHVDKKNACTISIPPLKVQLQPDSPLETLFIFTKLIDLPPGKFRENILENALKSNASFPPKAGILGYIANSNTLTLHQIYPFSILSAERLGDFLSGFLEMGILWFETIRMGKPGPDLPSGPSSGNNPPPFGIKL